MFNHEEMMKHQAKRKQEKAEMFMKLVKDDMMKESDEEIARMYTRDKSLAFFKLCKMKSGKFNIIDKNTSETYFSSYNLKEAKVEFINMHSISDGVGAKIFDAASNI